MGFIPIRRNWIRRPDDHPAQLLYTKECLVHGQLVEVQVYGPGPSGKAKYKSGTEMVDADRASKESSKKDYHPSLELAYMGLPSSPIRDRNLGGESSKRNTKS